jgi:hypothetical protein
MIIYVANYDFTDMVEAIRDAMPLEELASPWVTAATTNLTPEWIETQKRIVEEEYKKDNDLGGDVAFRWEVNEGSKGEEETDFRVEHGLYDDEYGDEVPVAMLVIHTMQVDE